MSVDVHPSAIVARGAELGDGVRVGPYCCIDSRVVIGEGTVLNAFVTVHEGVTIGRNCHIYEYTALGGEPQDHSYRGEASRVRIGDDNVIRENVTVNRATGEDNETVVGNGCLIMEGVHLAHNVHVGNAVTIANKVGLSGFVQVGDHTVFGGMAGVHQFVRIGCYCMVGGLYRVAKDIPPYTLAAGEPLRLEGLNSVGLKRAGFSAETRKAIRAFYRELYRRDRRFTDSLEELRGRRDAFIPEVQNVIDFYEGSRRGVTFWGHGSESD